MINQAATRSAAYVRTILRSVPQRCLSRLRRHQRGCVVDLPMRKAFEMLSTP